MPEDEMQWEAATFEGNRRVQNELFRKMSFREKVIAVEEMEKVIENLLKKRAAFPSKIKEDQPLSRESNESCAPESG